MHCVLGHMQYAISETATRRHTVDKELTRSFTQIHTSLVYKGLTLF